MKNDIPEQSRPYIAALLQGKEVQFRFKDSQMDWRDYNSTREAMTDLLTPDHECLYRIKPDGVHIYTALGMRDSKVQVSGSNFATMAQVPVCRDATLHVELDPTDFTVRVCEVLK